MLATENLLRPQQRKDMADEQKRLERAVQNPSFQGDRGAVQGQLRRIAKQLDAQSPKPFQGSDIDSAVKRESQLREELLRGMPSQEEMRKSPPGAVGKHLEWEKKNKQKLNEWKNIRLRINSDSSDPDVANFERYRPKTSTLNMDNAVVSGKQIFLDANVSTSVTFNSEQIAALRQLSPEIADRLATMTNDQRQEVKDVIGDGIGLSTLEEGSEDVKVDKKVTKKRSVSPEFRAAASARMKARHAAKKAQG